MIPKKTVKFISNNVIKVTTGLFLLVFIAITSIYLNVYAHEIYEGYSFRWNYVTGGVCNLKPSNDLLDDGLASIYSNALSHWNSNSAGITSWVDTPFASANVDFATPTKSNWLWGDGTLGMTFIRNSSGEWFISPNGAMGNFTSGKITYAQIQINSDVSSYSTYTKNYVLRHEMGHVLGLGHTDGITISIMNPNMVTDILENHDRTDLQDFY